MTDRQENPSERGYGAGVLESMQIIFGRGFLSPGGGAEIQRIFQGRALKGLKILDWGCGLGGATCALAQELGADDVLGIDIEPGNLSRAGRLSSELGLDDQVRLQLVTPGPLPFEAQRFDLVFSKEAICHIADKAALFADFRDVLRPDGRFTGSDWMCADAEDRLGADYRLWAGLLRREGLVFHFATPQAHEAALQAAGFSTVSIRNDQAQTLADAQACHEITLGAGRAGLESCLGKAGFDAFLRRSEARVAAIRSGELQRCHVDACP